MKRLILTAVAAMLAAGSGIANLDAAPPHHGGHPAPHVHVAPRAHATLVVRGHSVHVPVHVRGYRGWVSRCWFPTYRTYGYYCGTDQAWYYWYAPFDQYLPVSYMSVYPPTQAVPPVGVIPVAPGAPVATLPAGATFVPGPITAP